MLVFLLFSFVQKQVWNHTKINNALHQQITSKYINLKKDYLVNNLLKSRYAVVHPKPSFAVFVFFFKRLHYNN